MENKPQVRDLRNGDWYWVNKLVLEHPYLANSAKLVYMALAYHSNNNTQESFPGYERIMQLTGLKRRIITIAVKKLEEYYFIKVERIKGKVNEYKLLKLTDSKVVHNVHRGMQNRPLEVGTKVHTNNTHLTILNNKKVDIKKLKRLNDLKEEIKIKSLKE